MLTNCNQKVGLPTDFHVYWNWKPELEVDPGFKPMCPQMGCSHPNRHFKHCDKHALKIFGNMERYAIFLLITYVAIFHLRKENSSSLHQFKWI